MTLRAAFCWVGLSALGLLVLGADAAEIEPNRTPSHPPAVSPLTQDSAVPQAEAGALKKEAVDAATEAARAYPEDPLAYALLGSAYYNTGKSEAAARHLRRCLELNPSTAEAYGVLALIAYEKGETEEAVRLCREALQRGKPDPEILDRLGRALLDLGRADEAVRALEQAMVLAPTSSESAYLLGQAFLQAGDPGRAKAHFRKATELLPDHTQAFFGLFTACVRLQQVEEAERARLRFQELEAVDRASLNDRSNDTQALSGLPFVRQTVARTLFGAGQVHAAHAKPAQAMGLFARAAGLDAENSLYRAALEAAALQANRLGEALAAFERLSREQPDNALNEYYQGRIHARLQHFEAAETAFRNTQRLNPKWSQGYRALAELYLRADRQAADAVLLARRTVELEPTGPHYFLLAQACAKNRDRPGAIEAARRALALAPDEPRLKAYLQKLEQTP